ncbi:MAG: hypothetical protein AVDCRST_MAG73-3166 [uncultured Thermomicrobiales bacterium]|uniref:Macro domain-containing protein n=1 Tax=uncultured Thermomicrobiales bacterium TaxID=1645740 RepID=A0A6J4ULW6_9BACT|nr:MAG: hypothetical protein AVDCRST_MAG73-3166 [uncultured Thermomicrobiales bacterium]
MTGTRTGDDVRFGRTLVGATAGDLLAQPVEALVLAANRRGLLGAGPAGSVRIAAGPDVEREAMAQAPLPLGGAVVTSAGRLDARGVRSIVHAVIAGALGDASTVPTVRRALTAALAAVDAAKLRSVAIPPLGAGTGPGQLAAASVAAALVDEAVAYLRRSPTRLERIVFVAAVPADVPAFAAAIERARSRSWKQSA